MQTLVIGLVIVAVAFPAGWLVCRAWLTAQLHSRADVGADQDVIPTDKHHALLRAQRSRYRRRVEKILEVLRKHEATRDQIREKLTKLQQTMRADAKAAQESRDALERSEQRTLTLKTALDKSQEQLHAAQAAIAALEQKVATGGEGEAASRNEMDLLRIERDELNARVRRLAPKAVARDKSSETDDAVASLRSLLGETREKLAARDHHVRELEAQLERRAARLEELETTVNSWKQRVNPLARQLQLQRDVIRRSRGGLPQHHASIDDGLEGPPDELQRIRGVGPALERRLLANGIFHFEQIAALSEPELQALADKLAIAPALPVRDEWVAQARRLHAEKRAEPA